MSHRTNDLSPKSFRYRTILCTDVARLAARVLQLADSGGYQSGVKATIYHNPQCGTSRKTLAILHESGVEVTVREYLKDPPARDELKRLYQRAGLSPRDGLRTKEPLAAQLGLDDANDEAILDAMMEHPILINRPLVETAKGVRLCRPQDVVRDLL